MTETSPITYGLTGLVFGALAENGVVVQTVSATADSRVKEILDNFGNIIGVGSYAFKRDYRIDTVFLAGNAGLAAASVGSSITISNALNTNGVSGGVYVVKSVAENLSNEDFIKFDVNITQYPAI